MKSIVLVFLSFLIISSVYSQDDENGLNPIRKRVKEIDANIDQDEKSYFNGVNLVGDSINNTYSLEGAELYRIINMDITKYFDEGELVKIDVLFTGTHENLRSEYYFQEDHLIFVRKDKTIFHKSRYHKDFDESKYSTSYNHFYFIDGILIKWVAKGGKTQIEVENEKSPEFSKNESVILHDIELYRKYYL